MQRPIFSIVNLNIKIIVWAWSIRWSGHL